MANLKKLTLLAALAIVSMTSFGFGLKTKEDSVVTHPNDHKGFAVIELFTSEGCSSCPSADALVARIQKESVNEPVYILAFHVDYWNRAGWKDRFSNAAFSERQSRYAQWLKLSEIYTPQAVINGSKEVVGSDEDQMRKSLNTFVEQESPGKLSLADLAIKQTSVSFSYQIEKNMPNTSLQIALVQKNAVTKVLKGENKGLTLSHVQIVRDFQTIDLAGANTGTAKINLTPGASPHGFEVIAFLQNNTTGEIIAATKLSLDNSFRATAN